MPLYKDDLNGSVYEVPDDLSQAETAVYLMEMNPALKQKYDADAVSQTYKNAEREYAIRTRQPFEAGSLPQAAYETARGAAVGLFGKPIPYLAGAASKLADIVAPDSPMARGLEEWSALNTAALNGDFEALEAITPTTETTKELKAKALKEAGYYGQPEASRRSLLGYGGAVGQGAGNISSMLLMPWTALPQAFGSLYTEAYTDAITEYDGDRDLADRAATKTAMVGTALEYASFGMIRKLGGFKKAFPKLPEAITRGATVAEADMKGLPAAGKAIVKGYNNWKRSAILGTAESTLSEAVTESLQDYFQDKFVRGETLSFDEYLLGPSGIIGGLLGGAFTAPGQMKRSIRTANFKSALQQNGFTKDEAADFTNWALDNLERKRKAGEKASITYKGLTFEVSEKGLTVDGRELVNRVTRAETLRKLIPDLDQRLADIPEGRRIWHEAVLGTIDESEFIDRLGEAATKAGKPLDLGESQRLDVKTTVDPANKSELTKERLKLLAKVDPELFGVLVKEFPNVATRKDTKFNKLAQGEIDVQSYWEDVLTVARTGDYKGLGFSEEERKVLQRKFFAPGFMDLIHANEKPMRALPLDRSTALRTSMEPKMGIAGASLAIEALETSLYEVARGTLNPVTGANFETVSDFINSEVGNLTFVAFDAQLQAMRLYDAAAPEGASGIFLDSPGDSYVIGQVIGATDALTMFHEFGHYLMQRIDPNSTMAKQVEKYIKKINGLENVSFAAFQNDPGAYRAQHEAVAEAFSIWMISGSGDIQGPQKALFETLKDRVDFASTIFTLSNLGLDPTDFKLFKRDTAPMQDVIKQLVTGGGGAIPFRSFLDGSATMVAPPVTLPVTLKANDDPLSEVHFSAEVVTKLALDRSLTKAQAGKIVAAINNGNVSVTFPSLDYSMLFNLEALELIETTKLAPEQQNLFVQSVNSLMKSMGFKGLIKGRKRDVGGVRKGAFIESARALSAKYQLAVFDQLTQDVLGKPNNTPIDVRAPRHGTGLFALSTKANLKRAQAELMEAQGVDALTIKKHTGFERVIQSEPMMYEIDDTDLTLKHGTFKPHMSGKTVGWLVDAPGLFLEYPDLADIKVEHLVSNDALGEYRHSTDIIMLVDGLSLLGTRQVLVHEIQHAIQERAGMSVGTNSDYEAVYPNAQRSKLFDTASDEAFDAQERLLTLAIQEANTLDQQLLRNLLISDPVAGLTAIEIAISKERRAATGIDAAMNELIAWLNIREQQPRSANDSYIRTSGEALARVAEVRLHMDAAARENTLIRDTLEKLLVDNGVLQQGQTIEQVLVHQNQSRNNFDHIPRLYSMGTTDNGTPLWISRMRASLEDTLDNKVFIGQIENKLRAGAKKFYTEDELLESGLLDYVEELKEQGTKAVMKKDVLAWLDANAVKIDEIVKEEKDTAEKRAFLSVLDNEQRIKYEQMRTILNGIGNAVRRGPIPRERYIEAAQSLVELGTGKVNADNLVSQLRHDGPLTVGEDVQRSYAYDLDIVDWFTSEYPRFAAQYTPEQRHKATVIQRVKANLGYASGFKGNAYANALEEGKRDLASIGIDPAGIDSFESVSRLNLLRKYIGPLTRPANVEYKSTVELPDYAGVGEDYTELLMTIPGNKYEGMHYSEVRGILLDVSFRTHYTEDGRKVLLIDEMQSDLHQKASKLGGVYWPKGASRKQFIQKLHMEVAALENEIRALQSERFDIRKELRKTDQNTPEFNKLRNKLDANIDRNTSLRTSMHKRNNVIDKIELGGQAGDAYTNIDIPPDTPFKNLWPLLAMKRMLRWAVDNEFDSVAWATGDMVASKWENAEAFKAFYDRELVFRTKKYVKRFKGEVGRINIPEYFEEFGEVNGLDITPEMKAQLSSDPQPLYSMSKQKFPPAPEFEPTTVKNNLSSGDLMASNRDEITRILMQASRGTLMEPEDLAALEIWFAQMTQHALRMQEKGTEYADKWLKNWESKGLPLYKNYFSKVGQTLSVHGHSIVDAGIVDLISAIVKRLGPKHATALMSLSQAELKELTKITNLKNLLTEVTARIEKETARLEKSGATPDQILAALDKLPFYRSFLRVTEYLDANRGLLKKQGKDRYKIEVTSEIAGLIGDAYSIVSRKRMIRDMIATSVYFSDLVNPAGRFADLTSNLIYGFMLAAPHNLAKATVDTMMVVSGLHKQRRHFFKEALPSLNTMQNFRALSEGTRLALSVWHKGANYMDVQQKWDTITAANKNVFYAYADSLPPSLKKSFIHMIGRGAELPKLMMLMADVSVRTLAEDVAKRQAEIKIREWKAKGILREQLLMYAADSGLTELNGVALKDMPEKKLEELMEKSPILFLSTGIQRAANEAVHVQKPDALTQEISKFRNRFDDAVLEMGIPFAPFRHFVMRYLNVTSNIMRAVAEMTPMGLALTPLVTPLTMSAGLPFFALGALPIAAKKLGQKDMTDFLAKQLLAHMLIGLYMFMRERGWIIPPAATSKQADQYRQLEPTLDPYRINIPISIFGEHSFTQLPDPIGTMLAPIATAVELLRNKDLDPESDEAKELQNMAYRHAIGIFSTSPWLRGTGEVMKLFQGPGSGERFVRTQVGRYLVPAGPVFRMMNDAALLSQGRGKPYVDFANLDGGAGQYIKAMASEYLSAGFGNDFWEGREIPLSINYLGKPTMRAQILGFNVPAGWMPYTMGITEVERAWADISIYPKPRGRTLDGIELEQEEWISYNLLYGQGIKDAADKVIQKPFYQKAPDWQKQLIMSKLFALEEKKSKLIMYRTYRDLISRKRDHMLEKFE